MSTYLQLVQALHREARLPGAAPTSVDGQTGRALDLVSWVRDAYVDVQRMSVGRWQWLRGYCNINVLSGSQATAFDSTAATDSVSGAVIEDRFKSFVYDDVYDLPKIYLTATGDADEQYMVPMSWRIFRGVHRFQGTESGRPSHVSYRGDTRRLVYAPTANDDFTIQLPYWKTPQIMSASSEVPEMPPEYHDIIIWFAMAKYGYNNIRPELLTRADAEAARIQNDLEQNQLWAMESPELWIADPLA